MSNKKLYSKNPITEALIDLQLDQPLSVSAAQLKEFGSEIKSNYPETKERNLIQTTFQLADGKPLQTQNVAIEGYEFWNTSKTEVVQARRNGFSFSRLKPYEDWNVHFPKAMSNLELYRKRFSPTNANRLAVRFINIVKIPHEKAELKDYFVCGPDIPPSLPQDLDAFLYRAVVRFDSTTRAVVTLAPGQTGKVGSDIEIMLDIDVFSLTSVSVSDTFEKTFEKLHTYAENIFEAYITDKTRELIR